MFNWLSELFGSNSTTRKNLRDKFTDIYINNTFGGKESRSGEGSNFVQTDVIRQELPKLLEELGVKIFLDAPCGDLFWIKETPLNVEKYIGIDIVETLVGKNKQQFHDDRYREFYCLNLVENILPRADVIFCRDCLVHLHYAEIKKVISNFKKSQSTYLLTTTFTDRKSNVDLIGKNIWRPLNLQATPFNFPPPLKLINEKCTEANNQFTDKCLGLWLLEDIPD
jgi:SAM-dependent methyltransferase